MNTEDKYSVTFSHPSFGSYSAHSIASDGFNDYNEGLSLLMDCDVGETVEDDFGEEWRRDA